MHLDKLKSVLNGDIELIENIDWPPEAQFNDVVTIYPKQVIDFITRYIKGSISSEDLSSWAGFICTRAEYETPDNQSDEDFYEKMWDVLSYLSTPEIDGEITVKLVNEYLRILKKYEN